MFEIATFAMSTVILIGAIADMLGGSRISTKKDKD